MSDETIRPTPRVSVLMTTYNGARFIGESIDSVLTQTFEDFELVVVDDGSTDDTPRRLAGYDDPRLRVIRAERNLGVVGARNLGFAALRGEYVATLDHDDICLPRRLEAEVARLDGDPAAVMVVPRCLLWRDGVVGPGYREHPGTSMLLRWMLHLKCAITYSSLMFRAAAARRADGGYLRPDAIYADDYELALRLALAGDVALIDEPMLITREHGANTSHRVGEAMYRSVKVFLRDAYIPLLGADAGEAARLIAWHVGCSEPVPDSATLYRLGVLLERLLTAFLATCQPKPEDRARIVAHAGQIWWQVVRAGVRNGCPWFITAYWRRPASLPSDPRATPADIAGSIAAGLLRLPRPRPSMAP